MIDAASWVIVTLDALDELEQLPQNWDTYGSDPIHPASLYKARALVANIGINTLPTPQVIPVSGGSIGLVWKLGRKELELEVKPDGAIEYLRTVGRPTQANRNAMNTGQVGNDYIRDVRLLIKWLASE